MKRRNISILLVTVLLAIGLVGCGSSKGTPTKIVATDNGWDSQKVHNAIAELVVENAYNNYTFEVSTASSTMNWQSLIAGEVDLDIESWVENVASYKDDVARGDIVDMGSLVPDSRQGVYVPRYVVEGDPDRGIEPMAPGLKTVQDLKKYPSVFPDDENKAKGRMYGSIPGWMADEILYKKYEAYGLNENFTYTRLGSEAALFASLVSAYNLGQGWVGYCYEPTWVTGKLDLILLEDAPYEPTQYLEGKTAFPNQELRIVSSGKFESRAPELQHFFKNYKTSSTMIAGSLAHMDETKASYTETAIWLLKNNEGLLDQWLPSENAAKMREFLAKQK